jgi:N6-L-threonylcarbamoyladenine synthase
MLVLGIETSCDETAIAVVEDGRKVIANQVLTQIFKHQVWGGVIPEVASRLHLEHINDLLEEALKEAKLSMHDIDTIAVTSGPGLTGSLMVGVNVAKILSWVHNKPLVEINHLYGHVSANFIDTDLEPPFICMLASGGHTQVIEMSSYTDMKILGETIDDAAGEAFDKVARLMGLPYPGGPELDRLAQSYYVRSTVKGQRSNDENSFTVHRSPFTSVSLELRLQF